MKFVLCNNELVMRSAVWTDPLAVSEAIPDERLCKSRPRNVGTLIFFLNGKFLNINHLPRGPIHKLSPTLKHLDIAVAFRSAMRHDSRDKSLNKIRRILHLVKFPVQASITWQQISLNIYRYYRLQPTFSDIRNSDLMLPSVKHWRHPVRPANERYSKRALTTFA